MMSLFLSPFKFCRLWYPRYPGTHRHIIGGYLYVPLLCTIYSTIGLILVRLMLLLEIFSVCIFIFSTLPSLCKDYKVTASIRLEGALVGTICVN